MKIIMAQCADICYTDNMSIKDIKFLTFMLSSLHIIKFFSYYAFSIVCNTSEICIKMLCCLPLIRLYGMAFPCFSTNGLTSSPALRKDIRNMYDPASVLVSCKSLISIRILMPPKLKLLA